MKRPGVKVVFLEKADDPEPTAGLEEVAEGSSRRGVAHRSRGQVAGDEGLKVAWRALVALGDKPLQAPTKGKASILAAPGCDVAF